VAAAVAREIRRNVEAALAEAEIRQQLKQVQHDLEIARSIQQSLLPQDRLNLNGFEIAGWNCSADATGGDFFDWKQTSDGRLVVTLADVTGHGIGPALLAAVCRAYSRSSFNSTNDLVAAMRNINRLLAADVPPGRFATFVAVLCSENDNTVELLSAGQGPLLSYSSHSGTFHEIESHSIPLGLMPEINPTPPAVLEMEPGDLLLLVTDGFIEWEDRNGEQFGTERVAKTIQRISNLKPHEIIAELYRSTLEFADGTPQLDDLTAIVIKRVPITAAESGENMVPSAMEEALTVG
jgi:serine phosphatase RsbU (regulator of sigma subunit)